EPHAGERVWRNILKSDPSVDLVHFTILRPPEKQDGTPIRELSLIAFPIRELFDVKLDDFDLIIFDRYSRRGIIPQAYVENVVRYVRKGGAFLEAAGPSFGTPMSLYRTPLGEILPTEPTGNVYEDGFKPQLTEAGRRHPVTEDLSGAGKPGETPSWVRWFRQVEARVHHGTTVMNGDHSAPLLVLDRVGKGLVAQLLSDQLWLWARGFEGGGPQAELLRRRSRRWGCTGSATATIPRSPPPARSTRWNSPMSAPPTKSWRRWCGRAAAACSGAATARSRKSAASRAATPPPATTGWGCGR